MFKAIVTGGTGYIGSHLVRNLLSQKWDVSLITDSKFGYDNIKDISTNLEIFEYDGNINDLIEFFSEKQADVVFHLAAAVLTNPSPCQIKDLIRSNIEFGTEILEAMSHSKTKLFIGTGTNWQNYNGCLNYDPVDLYAATKEAFEKILKFYVEANEIRAITLRIFDVYGNDDTRPKIWNILREIAGTDECIDMSFGEQEIDLVDISDIVNAYICSYELLKDSEIKNEVFGVGTGYIRKLKDLVIDYKNEINKEMKINWGGREYKTREMMKAPSHYKILPNWKAKYIPFKQENNGI